MVAAVAGALAASLLVAPLPSVAATARAVPAATVEYPVSAGGTFELTGRGYGHGRGLSQWGAYGAATRGLSTASILAHYYPGTSLTGQPDTDITVGLSFRRPGELIVDAAPQMRMDWRDGSLALPDAVAGDPVIAWRLSRPGGGLLLEYLGQSATAWAAYSTVPGTEATFAARSVLLRMVLPDWTRREVRGGLRAVANGETDVLSVNVLPMESYLRSVVPSEMPSSWHPQALGAQVVAARTYASRLRHLAAGPVDTCDTVSCQVYSGVATYTLGGQLIRRYEAAATDSAITATANRVLITGGAFSYALAQFSASNGGWSTSGGVSYLPAKADPYDGVVPSVSHRWTQSVSAAAVARAYPSVGRVQSLQVTSRNGNGEWGGRILSMRVVGDGGSVTVTGPQFRFALGLRSEWWSAPVAAPVQDQPSGGLIVDMTGDGRADVVARRRSTGELLLYRGAAGGLQAPTVMGTGWQMHDQLVSPGDVTGDGRNDLYGRERATGALWLYSGNGAGGFSAQRTVGTGWQMHDLLLAAGDVNGDGRPDLYGRERATGALWFYAGDGVGGFSSRRTLGTGWRGLDMLVGTGDLSGDGVPDLLARARGTGELWMYRGDRTGGMSSRRVINTGWQSFDLLAGGGDVDGDGRTDLLARLPGVSGGTLRLYPLVAPGSVLPGRVFGTGWDMHNAVL